MTTHNVVVLAKVSNEQTDDMLKMLDTAREEVLSGEIKRLGLITDRGAIGWGTEFSKSDDSRIDAAMMIQLGLRRLGFTT